MSYERWKQREEGSRGFSIIVSTLITSIAAYAKRENVEDDVYQVLSELFFIGVPIVEESERVQLVQMELARAMVENCTNEALSSSISGYPTTNLVNQLIADSYESYYGTVIDDDLLTEVEDIIMMCDALSSAYDFVGTDEVRFSMWEVTTDGEVVTAIITGDARIAMWEEEHRAKGGTFTFYPRCETVRRAKSKRQKTEAELINENISKLPAAKAKRQFRVVRECIRQ